MLQPALVPDSGILITTADAAFAHAQLERGVDADIDGILEASSSTTLWFTRATVGFDGGHSFLH